MGIWFYEAFNGGGYRSVVKYGKQPNTNGPSSKGYSVVLHSRRVTPDWCIGYEEDPLVVETMLRQRYTWKIFDGDWEMTVNVSVNGDEFLRAGRIKILGNYGRFNIWMHGDSIVIGNDDGKLGRESDGISFKYFHVTSDKIIATNDFPVLDEFVAC